MSESSGNLDGLIESVVEGNDVDWKALESPTDERERRLLKQLRLVAALGRVAADPDAPADDDALAPGQRWGGLELLEPLSRGPFGEVWRARDVHLERTVAVKFIPENAYAGSPSVPPTTHEGQLLSRVRHPNVVTVHGANRINGRIGIWMEYIDGHTLSDLLKIEGRLDAPAAAQTGVDVCRALSALHAAGLVHRDVKAQNVMRERSGRVVVMDLGVGIDTKHPSMGYGAAGTPLYLAPELFAGSHASVTSDIYSVGVLLFHVLTGTFPVYGDTYEALSARHRQQQRLALTELRPDLPERFASVIERTLHPDRSGRFQTAAELEQALLEWTPVPATARRRFSRAASAAVIGVMLVAATAWWLTELSRQDRPAAVLNRQDTILIASFDNRTGDSSLNGALDRALTHELSQSPHVSIASTRRRDELLALMGRPPQTVIDRAVAREMSVRDGRIRLVLAGTVEAPVVPT